MVGSEHVLYLYNSIWGYKFIIFYFFLVIEELFLWESGITLMHFVLFLFSSFVLKLICSASLAPSISTSSVSRTYMQVLNYHLLIISLRTHEINREIKTRRIVDIFNLISADIYMPLIPSNRKMMVSKITEQLNKKTYVFVVIIILNFIHDK